MTQIPEAILLYNFCGLWYSLHNLPDYFSYVRNSFIICHHAGLPAGRHTMTRIVKIDEIIFIPVAKRSLHAITRVPAEITSAT